MTQISTAKNMNPWRIQTEQLFLVVDRKDLSGGLFHDQDMRDLAQVAYPSSRGRLRTTEGLTHTRDALVSMGERLSVPLMLALLRQRGLDVVRLSALDIVTTDSNYGAAVVDRGAMSINLSRAMEGLASCDVVLMEGFVGRDGEGEVTTLGRGGSDLTASLVSNMLGASRMEKSTDVPGMLTADPRVVPSSKIIESMSYEEAMELCHFRAKVIYPPTLIPLR